MTQITPRKTNLVSLLCCTVGCNSGNIHRRRHSPGSASKAFWDYLLSSTNVAMKTLTKFIFKNSEKTSYLKVPGILEKRVSDWAEFLRTHISQTNVKICDNWSVKDLLWCRIQIYYCSTWTTCLRKRITATWVPHEVNYSFSLRLQWEKGSSKTTICVNWQTEWISDRVYPSSAQPGSLDSDRGVGQRFVLQYVRSHICCLITFSREWIIFKERFG